MWPFKRHRHKWSKWTFAGTFGFTDYQSRVCQECGESQQRRAGWSLDNKPRALGGEGKEE